MLVVAANSPLRYLCVLDCAHVLPVLFGRILMPQAVLDELQHPKTPTAVRTWLANPPAWLEVRSIVGRPDVALSTLEAGEQEAIVLDQELHADILLVDDGKARDLAIQRGLRVMGTVGVLEQAAARGLVALPDVLTQLLTTNFRILRTIINDALTRDAARKRQEGENQNEG
jgi:predicted nucleic acid-binding protein